MVGLMSSIKNMSNETIEFSYVGSPEETEILFLKEVLIGCERFVDVGTNNGIYSFFANQWLTNSQIDLVEANPTLKPHLQKLIEQLSELGGNNNRFEIIDAAVVDKSGDTLLFPTNRLGVGSIFVDDADQELVEVKTITLDDVFVPDLKTVIKMDIEGAEYRALLGAKEFLASDNTKFFCELHGWGDKEYRKYPLNVMNLMFANGYDVKKIGSHYLFEKSSLINRTFSYLICFPYIFIKYILHRYLTFMVPLVRKILNKVFPNKRF